MSFLRPEATAQLRRWRETLAGAAAAGVGAWLAFASGGILFALGLVMIAGGLALAVAGVQRARFRLGTDGAGVVQVVEGRVVYYGPWSGGAASLDRLGWLEIVPGEGGAGRFVLIEEGGERLEIPADARGADALFDVFAALPAFDAGRMLRSMRPPVRDRTLVWQRDRPRLH